MKIFNTNADILLFDYGGVIMESIDQEMSNTIIRELGLQAPRYNQFFNRNIHLVQTGKLSEKQFIEELAKLTPTGVNRCDLDAGALFSSPFVGKNRFFGDASKILNELLLRDIQLAVLSNTIPSHARAIREQNGYHWFKSKVFLSYEIGHRKPSKKAFDYVAKSLQKNFENFVLIDDSKENVDAASSLGIDSVLFCADKERFIKLREQLAYRKINI